MKRVRRIPYGPVSCLVGNKPSLASCFSMLEVVSARCPGRRSHVIIGTSASGM
jgi:hypothetical protein